jgi:hypothetical protein
MDQAGLGHLGEHRAGQVHRRAGARRGIGQPRMRAGIGNQLRHRLHGQVVVHFEHDGRRAQQADGREIAARIERHVLVDMRVERVGRNGAEADRVAIGRCLGHGFHADVAACPGPVLDHHRLPQLLGHALAHGARHQVGGAAGRVGHDEADGFAREGIGGQGAAGAGQQRHGRGGQRGADDGGQEGATRGNATKGKAMERHGSEVSGM